MLLYSTFKNYKIEKEKAMKKLFALLLAVIMVISMAACAPAEPAGTTEGKADTTTAAKDTTAAKEETTTEAAPTPWTDPKCFDLTGIVADDTINIGIPINATVIPSFWKCFSKLS